MSSIKELNLKLKVHGGYHDAGDSDRNAYQLMVPIVLMTTYEVFPGLFTDDQFNIPDIFDANFNIVGKGNGIPDILDEAMWGTMFWEYMQTDQESNLAWGNKPLGEWESAPMGCNFDQDTKLWGTEMNDANTADWRPVFLNLARLRSPTTPSGARICSKVRGEVRPNHYCDPCRGIEFARRSGSTMRSRNIC